MSELDMDVDHLRPDSRFDEAAAEPLLQRIHSLAAQYVTRQEREDLPVTLLDFAVELIYGVGHADAVSEIAEGVGDIGARHDRRASSGWPSMVNQAPSDDR